MSSAKTISVPHLGGIEAGYYIPTPYIATKPTVILVNPFVTSVDLFNPQFSNKALTSALNLVAIEMLGHGKTQAKAEHYTYWDTALMNLQAMDALGIEKAFVLGVSQGGWVTVRMALLAPERIQGVIPVGTSMDFESSPRTLELGCWDGVGMCSPLIDEWTRTHPVSDEWGPGEEFCDDIGDNGFGKDRNLYQSEREFLKGIIRENYKGDEGRRRARMCTVNLRDRDGLRGRLWDVKCPVLWMQVGYSC